MSRLPRGRSTETGPADELAPAEVLGDVWPLLDEMPRAAASSRLTATTIEMAAVSVGNGASGRWASGGEPLHGEPRHGEPRHGEPRHGEPLHGSLRAWLVPVASVAAALAAGIMAGWMTAPSGGPPLANLPLVQHLDLLQEAGSEAFLEQLAARRAESELRGIPRPGGEMARRAAEPFAAQIESLRASLRVDRGRTAAERREWFESLPLDERHELEKSAAAYRTLSPTERELLAGVAAALVDPARPELREAAQAWHMWLAAVRPTDRPDIIGYGTDKRLAWIDWYATRFDARNRPAGSTPAGGTAPGGVAAGSAPLGGPSSGSGTPSDRLPRDWERRDRRPPGVRPGSGGAATLRPGSGPPPAGTPAAPR